MEGGEEGKLGVGERATQQNSDIIQIIAKFMPWRHVPICKYAIFLAIGGNVRRIPRPALFYTSQKSFGSGNKTMLPCFTHHVM